MKTSPHEELSLNPYCILFHFHLKLNLSILTHSICSDFYQPQNLYVLYICYLSCVIYGLNVWFPRSLTSFHGRCSKPLVNEHFCCAEVSWIGYPVTLLSLTPKISEEALPKNQSSLELQYFLLTTSVYTLPQEVIVTVVPVF